MFQELIKNYWHYWVLTILSVAFFIGTSGYIYLSQKGEFVKWGSPDETANYIFTKLYAQEKKMEIFEKYNLSAGDIIHPRSMKSDSGFIKPVSFLGIILIYGKIASVFGYKIIPYLTPFFAALGIVFFYFLIKEIFGKRNAILSAALLACFPPYFYYSARSMFHNVLFTVFLIMAFYFSVLIVKYQKKKEANGGFLIFKINWQGFIFSALAGASLGLAIAARASELIWLIPAFFILWLFNIRKIGLLKLIIFLSFLFLAILPNLYWNKILYGSAVLGGYEEMNQSILNLANAGFNLVKGAFSGKLSGAGEQFTRIKNDIFHFGLRPEHSFKMLYGYFTRMFYFIFWPAVLGFFLFLGKIKKWKKKHWAYLTAFFSFSAILIFYYGSWEFFDNPDVKRMTIGNSYTRYWLPVYLGALPFASIFILWLTKIFKNKAYILLARAAIILFIYLISLRFVLAGSEEGLITSFYNGQKARAEQERVLELTENNSVIITKYHDKLLFPERKVIVGLFDDKNMINKYSKIADLLPLYYFNFTFPEKDIEYLNNKRLKEFGLRIAEVGKVNKDFTLYRLRRN